MVMMKGVGPFLTGRTVHSPNGVQELCESRGGRPGLSVLMSLTVSVDVKQHSTVLRHNLSLIIMSTDIRGHEALLHHHHYIYDLIYVHFLSCVLFYWYLLCSRNSNFYVILN